MDNEFRCPECEYVTYYADGLTYHKRREHRKYGVAGQCQAYLLTPSSRNWAKYSGQNIRCKSPAKDLIMPFCGNHAKLADFIVEIVWR